MDYLYWWMPWIILGLVILPTLVMLGDWILRRTKGKKKKNRQNLLVKWLVIQSIWAVIVITGIFILVREFLRSVWGA